MSVIRKFSPIIILADEYNNLQILDNLIGLNRRKGCTLLLYNEYLMVTVFVQVEVGNINLSWRWAFTWRAHGCHAHKLVHVVWNQSKTVWMPVRATAAKYVCIKYMQTTDSHLIDRFWIFNCTMIFWGKETLDPVEANLENFVGRRVVVLVFTLSSPSLTSSNVILDVVLVGAGSLFLSTSSMASSLLCVS